MVADIETIPFDRDSFDLVISLDTIEHVPHPTRAVAELVRVLQPGGKFVLTTNNYFGLIGVWRLIMRLAGRRFTEFGQPINQPLMFFPSAGSCAGWAAPSTSSTAPATICACRGTSSATCGCRSSNGRAR